MKQKISLAALGLMLFSCGAKTPKQVEPPTANKLAGTWKLVKATLIEKGDTINTDYTKNTSFIKIINDTHFAFLQHDLTKGKDSAVYVSGGGRYSLADNAYTEHLEYCSAREWEGTDFKFTITVTNDTLVQHGVEKVESAGVNRINTETYVKVKG